MVLKSLKKELFALGHPEKAVNSARFFKMNKGQYGEGDIFIGITMPEQRKLAKKYASLSLSDIAHLLHSKEHEFRMTALLILVKQFQQGAENFRKECYELYLRNTAHINSWDLVDASAEFIVGPWLENKPEKLQVLQRLAQSTSLWERRIAMLSTFAYIKKGHAEEALQVAELLLKDHQDLIHKAVGWMLRETGKRCSIRQEEIFLKKHAHQMPRTMLRYAIEHFPEEKRQAYLKRKASMG